MRDYGNHVYSLVREVRHDLSRARERLIESEEASHQSPRGKVFALKLAALWLTVAGERLLAGDPLVAPEDMP